jgi:hypothetical protein
LATALYLEGWNLVYPELWGEKTDFSENLKQLEAILDSFEFKEKYLQVQILPIFA